MMNQIIICLYSACNPCNTVMHSSVHATVVLVQKHNEFLIAPPPQYVPLQPVVKHSLDWTIRMTFSIDKYIQSTKDLQGYHHMPPRGLKVFFRHLFGVCIIAWRRKHFILDME